eukprot:7788852-Pyramimonas_sp.AAC.1
MFDDEGLMCASLLSRYFPALTAVNLDNKCIAEVVITDAEARTLGGSLSGLTSLDITYTYNYNSLSVSYIITYAGMRALGSLTILTSLNITGCRNVRDVGALGSLSARLTTLDLTGCRNVTGVGALSSLSALTSLNLTS